MGEFITVRTSQIKPSQNFLKESTVAYILQCYKTGNLAGLPPTPIVRKGSGDEYIAIDGHNLIAVYDFLGKPCGVYVASNADDENEAVVARTEDLKEKFESSLAASRELSNQNLDSFQQLRSQYAIFEAGKSDE